jgi:hypothetical protein
MNHANWRCYLAVCFLALPAAQIQAQAQSEATKSLALETSSGDVSAVRQSKHSTRHMLPTAQHRARRESVADLGSAPHVLASASRRNGVVYIGTLTNQGGQVMESAVQHAIYLVPSNHACPSIAACWGNPEQFLADLSRSEFIHVTDQYVGTTGNGRYGVGVSGRVNYTIPAKPLTDADIQAIVHSMVVKDGGLSGYHHEYHVFLPPGQDECFDSAFTVCASNVFCAYHGSVDFSDVGHVIYSVEPWAGVVGCNALQPDGSTPNTQNSILSHELIESITDPDGDAWWNASGDLDLYGYEIGDECQWIFFSATSVGFLLDPVYLNGRLYYIQSEYNNHANGCTDGPGPGGS